jgi:hypothetical protein
LGREGGKERIRQRGSSPGKLWREIKWKNEESTMLSMNNATGENKSQALRKEFEEILGFVQKGFEDGVWRA